jgi:hypothetical protein
VNKHSTDVEFPPPPPPPPRVCMSIHPESKSCSDLSRVLVRNDPAAWRCCGGRGSTAARGRRAS